MQDKNSMAIFLIKNILLDLEWKRKLHKRKGFYFTYYIYFSLSLC